MELDIQATEEVASFLAKIVEEKREKYKNAVPGNLAKTNFEGWCGDQVALSQATYALDRDAASFEEGISRAVKAYLPYFKEKLSLRRIREPKYSDPYDQGALADWDFALPMAYFVALKPREEIVHICKETNYGRYNGTEKVNSHGSIFARMMRAYLLKDEDWLREEIDSLKIVSVAMDASHLSFMYPKSRWYPLFSSLFFKDKETYLNTAKEIIKWYRSRVKKDYTNERGYRYDVCVNVVLLATLKIANAYQNFSVKLEDQFLPQKLIRLA